MRTKQQELFNKLAHFKWDHIIEVDKEDEFLDELREAGQAELADEFETYRRTPEQMLNAAYDKFQGEW